MLPALIAAACWAAAGYVVGSDALKRQKTFREEVDYIKERELQQDKKISEAVSQLHRCLETLSNMTKRKDNEHAKQIEELEQRIKELESELVNPASEQELKDLKASVESKNAQERVAKEIKDDEKRRDRFLETKRKMEEVVEALAKDPLSEEAIEKAKKITTNK